MSQRIIFSNNLAEAFAEVLDGINYNKTAVVTDTNADMFALPLVADVPVVAQSPRIVIPSGDVNKNLQSATMVWKGLEQCGATRRTAVINIGGGVVTDLGGFAAATFKRGVPFVNVPTTLLGAVDAAVGGKTGVNFNGLKNEIGAFSEAAAVIISTRFFATLPITELRSGYAEMLKHGLLSDRQYFAQLLDYDLATDDATDHLLALLQRSVTIKSEVVSADPHEQGLRRALNLGHTIGHAFESLAMRRSSPVAHGYAVAWGLVVELVLSNIIYQFPAQLLHTTAQYVKRCYGSFAITCDDYDEIINLMRHDKKSLDGEINCSLLADIGDIKLGTVVTPDQVKAALDIYRDYFD